MPEPMDERRVGPRAAGEFTVKVNCAGQEVEAAGCDLAAGGVSCQLPGGFDVRAPAELNLILPDIEEGKSHRISCRGTLLRRETANSGKSDKVVFRLDDIAHGDEVEIDEYIAARVGHPVREDGIGLREVRLEVNGLSAFSDAYVPILHETRIRFSFGTSKEELECTALVVKCERSRADQPFEVVLFFTEVSPRLGERLKNYVAALEAE